jgi:pilus assembly protein Flp/PilA
MSCSNSIEPSVRLAEQDGSAIGAAVADSTFDKQQQRGTRMKNVEQLLKNLMTEDSGQDLIEYALVAALVGLGSVAAIGGLANSIENTFNSVGSALTNAVA